MLSLLFVVYHGLYYSKLFICVSMIRQYTQKEKDENGNPTNQNKTRKLPTLSPQPKCYKAIRQSKDGPNERVGGD
jgi:hypothetical protein